MQRPVQIPFPLSSFPGANPQEGAGRLINCYAEPLGEAVKADSAPAPQVWRGSRAVAARDHGENNYRGGLIVKNLSYEVFAVQRRHGRCAGNVNVLGPMLGTKKVSIARNQAGRPTWSRSTSTTARSSCRPAARADGL
jgi:hypothetical protein